MPQAVKIVSQPKEQSLTALRKQATASGSARQFSFRDREDSLDERLRAWVAALGAAFEGVTIRRNFSFRTGEARLNARVRAG